MFDVASGTGGHLVEENLLSHATAVGDGQVGFQVFPSIIVAIARQEDRDAESHAARDDRDLMDRVGVFAKKRDQRMTGLVVGGDPLLFVSQQHRLALCAHQDLVLGELEVEHGDLLAVHASRIEGSFIDHVGQVGTC